MSDGNTAGPVAHGGTARYSSVAIVLHWVIAAAIVVQLILSTRMEGRTPQAFAVFQLHKSIGITILLLSLLRLGWRLTHRPPPEPPMATWERALSRIVHVGFYVIMIGMPLTGWLMVSASRLSFPTLLYGVVPWPHIPGVAGLAAPQKALAHEIGEVGHLALAWGAVTLLALHVAGALKHQLFGADKPVLARMAPGARAGRWAEPRLALIVAGAAAAGLFALVVVPPVARSPALALAPAAVATPAPSTPPAPQAEASAPPPPAEASGSKPAEATQWTTSARSSGLGFETAWSGTPLRGHFTRWTAKIQFGPEALDRSMVVVRIDLKSVDTGDEQRDATLQGPDWFDAQAHPVAVFRASRFKAEGTGRYVAIGTLDLRGVRKPVSAPFRLALTGDNASADGTVTLDRKAFGVGVGPDAGSDGIPDEVKVVFSVKARKTGPGPD